MRLPTVDDIVRLKRDIPELALSRGDVGVVRSTWFAPAIAYEVEFDSKGAHSCARALVFAEHVQVDELAPIVN